MRKLRRLGINKYKLILKLSYNSYFANHGPPSAGRIQRNQPLSNYKWNIRDLALGNQKDPSANAGCTNLFVIKVARYKASRRSLRHLLKPLKTSLAFTKVKIEKKSTLLRTAFNFTFEWDKLMSSARKLSLI